MDLNDIRKISISEMSDNEAEGFIMSLQSKRIAEWSAPKVVKKAKLKLKVTKKPKVSKKKIDLNLTEDQRELLARLGL